ncbi:MAG: phosphoribosylaminoimidazolecarboxamide formyltransferase, phosphoribosylaminoimidazolecarboxamide formyltransferase / IMP cyclohydrolase [archaeon GW2011_AR3]|nr:MAG: phosphoribosylaminoimidazolecarboxamide formyltransferase, phosphoribosylaminoimidazolecarboxamide formyltransferase / IMP cyclohydrolase [archaeon GW2011_AR3]MBS3109942.1 bifunctional phosphoribosylaminoimidazolecarboxamide formyltransferase/IMP cyclohydrolase [Candidatus Woesearchaeota archaeon]
MVIIIKPKAALISVFDKTGIADFAKGLARHGIEILATGGTASLLEKNGIKITKVESYTGSPEILDGRVKTLHPSIFGGILAIRGKKEHAEQLSEHKLKEIDMIVVNLYPFEATIAKNPGMEDALENIDIGGVSLIRAAGKNFQDVAVIVDPKDYSSLLDEVEKGGIAEETLKKLAVKAFRTTAAYDSAIDNYLSERLAGEKVIRPFFMHGQEMRYGENPHQKGWFYKSEKLEEACVANAKMLSGKELSYNNILDANEAFELVKEFDEPCCAIIKHTNPSGVAVDNEISEAYRKALACDPLSAFGCVVAMNRKCDIRTAELMKPNFIEVVICPGFEPGALELLKTKKNLRLLETGKIGERAPQMEMRTVTGGLLVQSRDFPKLDNRTFKAVTRKTPSPGELEDMIFAIRVALHVKSNSVVFVKDKVTVGIGAGQMSRVDSVKIAVEKSQGLVKGSVMCSDAFFPFRDGVDEAAKAGVSAIVQPGGSIRDDEVVKAADEHGISMVFSGIRLFKH